MEAEKPKLPSHIKWNLKSRGRQEDILMRHPLQNFTTAQQSSSCTQDTTNNKATTSTSRPVTTSSSKSTRNFRLAFDQNLLRDSTGEILSFEELRASKTNFNAEDLASFPWNPPVPPDPARLNFEVLYDPEGLQGGKDPLKDRYKEFEDSNNENQAPDSLIEIAYSSNVGVEPLSERSVDTYNQPEDVPPNDENNPSN